MIAFAEAFYSKTFPLPSFPHVLSRVWSCFQDLTLVGDGELSFQEIHAYSMVTGTYLEPREVMLLRDLSLIYQVVVAKRRANPNFKSIESNDDLKKMFSSKGQKVLTIKRSQLKNARPS